VSGTWLASTSRAAVTSWPFGDHRQVILHQLAGVGTGGLRHFQGRACHIRFLHQLQLAGFQVIDVLFVAHDLMTDRLELVILAGLELLELQALDRGAAGSGIQFETFEPHLAIDHRLMRLVFSPFVVHQLGFGPGLVLGEFLEILDQHQQAAVPVLQYQQRANFI